jgi:hypothetical protein
MKQRKIKDKDTDFLMKKAKLVAQQQQLNPQVKTKNQKKLEKFSLLENQLLEEKNKLASSLVILKKDSMISMMMET